MGLFKKKESLTPESMYNKFSSSLYKSNGHKHVLIAPIKCSDEHFKKFNKRVNYLITGMRKHNFSIVAIKPFFTVVMKPGYSEYCHLTIIYK